MPTETQNEFFENRLTFEYVMESFPDLDEDIQEQVRLLFDDLDDIENFHLKKDKHGAKLRIKKCPGEDYQAIWTEMTCHNTSPDIVARSFFEKEYRLRWDKLFKDSRVLADETPISPDAPHQLQNRVWYIRFRAPNAFVSARDVTIRIVTLTLPCGSQVIVYHSLPRGVAEDLYDVQKAKGVVRATIHKPSGAVILKDGDDVHAVQIERMCAEGSIPAAIVRATWATSHENTIRMIKELDAIGAEGA